MTKPIAKMSLKELQNEISAYEQQIMMTSYGVKDLIYLDSLYVEAQNRGYLVQSEKTIKLVDPANK